MTAVIIVLIVLYGFAQVLITPVTLAAFAQSLGREGDCFSNYTECIIEADGCFFPSHFRKTTAMNWLGCVVVSLLCLLVCPITYIFEFIYWLFYVGRKENE